MELVVSVSPDGCTKALHNDTFSLRFLGQQMIRRASDIRWDIETQSWEIWFADGETYRPPTDEYRLFPSYEEAREFEVAIMNASLRTGRPPWSGEVLLHAIEIREQEG